MTSSTAIFSELIYAQRFWELEQGLILDTHSDPPLPFIGAQIIELFLPLLSH